MSHRDILPNFDYMFTRPFEGTSSNFLAKNAFFILFLITEKGMSICFSNIHFLRTIWSAKANIGTFIAFSSPSELIEMMDEDKGGREGERGGGGN